LWYVVIRNGINLKQVMGKFAYNNSNSPNSDILVAKICIKVKLACTNLKQYFFQIHFFSTGYSPSHHLTKPAVDFWRHHFNILCSCIIWNWQCL
jgi:hypothetical protein